MKKLFTIILAAIMCFCFTATAYAADDTGERPQDSSAPRLMVSDFTVEGGSLMPDKKTKVTVSLKNYSKSKAVSNIKLSVSEESGDIKPVGTGNKYVETIKPGATYTWELELTAAATAQIGEHAVTVASEYEDEYYNAYNGSDVIRINVKQTVGLDFSGVQLPERVYAQDTVTMDISLFNTGKSTLNNCKVDFDIDNLESGGTTYVGEIEPGEQGTATANLRVGSELGDFEGTVTITYEDEFGKSYTKEQQVTTTVAEKPAQTVADDEKQAKYPLWWAFLLGGAVVGGAAGCAVPVSIYKARQRKRDELML